MYCVLLIMKMIDFRHILLSIFIFVFICSPSFAADYYIDPSDEVDGNGTITNPYNTWGSVSFSSNNSYYQKCGTSETTTITIPITATNVVVSAYRAGPIHEDDDPNYGLYCGDDVTEKPEVVGDTGGSRSDYVIDIGSTATNHYVTINSMHVRGGFVGIRCRSPNNTIQYNYCEDNWWGIRLPTSNTNYNTIEYNHIDMQTPVDEGGSFFDAIVIDYGSNNIVRYNACQDYDHGCVLFDKSSYNECYGNKAYRDTGNSETPEDFAFSAITGGNYNDFWGNYSNSGGQCIEIYGASGNRMWANVCVCDHPNIPHSYQGCIQIDSYSSYAADDNLVYLNTIYDNDNNTDQPGILIEHYGAATGTADSNIVRGNIVQKVGRRFVQVTDSLGLVDNYEFHDNIAYDYGTNQYANIEGSTYANAAAFNALGYASGNLDTSPGMADPANGDFSLGASANAIGIVDFTSVDNKNDFDEGLCAGTDLSAEPLILVWCDRDLQGGSDAWDAGAFERSGVVLSGLAPTTQQECGADPQSVTMQATSDNDVNAYCRYSDDPADNTYALMAGNQWSTGEGTTSHSTSVSQACGGLTLYYVICNTASDGSGDSSSRYEITVDVAAAGSATTPPLSIEYGNALTMEYGNALTIEAQ